MKLYEKTLEKKEIFNGRVIHVTEEVAELEDGTKALREVVGHPGGVCIAALTENDELLFVKQFRYPYKEEVQKHLLESITYAEVKGKIECMASSNATAVVRQQATVTRTEVKRECDRRIGHIGFNTTYSTNADDTCTSL